jgi:MFS family permease
VVGAAGFEPAASCAQENGPNDALRIRRQPREIVLTALCRMGEQATFCISSAFVLAYGTGTLHMPRNFLLQALLTATAISVFMTSFAGHLSDRFGRKRICICSAPC